MVLIEMPVKKKLMLPIFKTIPFLCFITILSSYFLNSYLIIPIVNILGELGLDMMHDRTLSKTAEEIKLGKKIRLY